jgi:hypothetical protein
LRVEVPAVHLRFSKRLAALMAQRIRIAERVRDRADSHQQTRSNLPRSVSDRPGATFSMGAVPNERDQTDKKPNDPVG